MTDKEKSQALYITFKDGTQATFVGEACIFKEDETKQIAKISFSSPRGQSLSDFLIEYFPDWKKEWLL